jgi:hydrophobe/amphiphile efflux-1 (HAE1) family protein
MPAFFIQRPIFAWVVALFIILAGLLAIPNLPISQYPSVAPPSVEISATYPGASAETVDQAVTSLIEQELNGAKGMLYYESQSNSYGRAQITATFAPGTDPDLATVDVQNRIKKAEARLPQAVMQMGLQVEKASGSFLLVATLSSQDGRLDQLGLADYATRNVLNEIRRVPGVGKAELYAAQRAMRIWLDPDKLVGYGIGPAEVNAAIAAQNRQVPAGALGDRPAPSSQQVSASVIVRGLLGSVEEFGDIVLRANRDGSTVRLRDVARIEVGGETYQFGARLNGKETAAIAVQLAPGANALQTATEVEARLAALSQYFPAGVSYEIPYNTAPFVKISIEQVVKTLAEAMVLVFLVMLVFLQNLRYTLIPTIVVPIALLGTFAVMMVAGFSINVLTMFGMVLAIGILVDDAIVVVENVERIMAEEGLSPLEATRKAMGQITGAIVGITLVLAAVFLPLAFMSGSVGVIYRQFSLSMAASILFSGFLALTLTPALCATLLKPIPAGHHERRKGFSGWFNRSFGRLAGGYLSWVGRLVLRVGRTMLVYALLIGLLVFGFLRLPSSFLPVEDQGYLITDVQLPAGASANRTQAALTQLEQYYLGRPSVDSIVAITGFSFSGMGQNAGLAFTTFKDWSTRGPDESAQAEADRANGALFMGVKDAQMFSLVPPAIPELGTASGFSFRLQDRGGLGHAALLAARNQLLGAVAQSPVIAYARVEGLEDAPQLLLDIDRDKAGALGVDFGSVATVVSTALGSATINDFANLGRMQRVIVQAEAASRMTPEAILGLNVPGSRGDMVPLSAFATTSWTTGPVQLTRYNGYPSYKISGDAIPGFSTGQAMAEMERLVGELPAGIGYEWTGQSLQEIESGAQAPMLMALALIVVFLVLAALYESWSIPLSVLLIVPLGVIGAVLAVLMRGMPNDVFFKVGLITIIGLSAKNAILIIEFAKDLVAEGKGLAEAALEAARLRFRPIVMTSLAFILGVLPLAIATGASSASQRAIGTGVLGGMVAATVLGVLYVPVFVVAVQRLLSRRRGDGAAGGRQDRRALEQQ